MIFAHAKNILKKNNSGKDIDPWLKASPDELENFQSILMQPLQIRLKHRSVICRLHKKGQILKTWTV